MGAMASACPVICLCQRYNSCATSWKKGTALANVLVTNDDGIYAAGLRTLTTHLLNAGHRVMVVAPDRERSATSHALTLHDPIRAISNPDLIHQGCTVAFAVTGTPVDCVKLAFNSLMTYTPDLVISGINHGPNLGNDIAYSGTVSAALEAARQGARSMATSHVGGYLPDVDFNGAAAWITQFVPQAIALHLPTDTILNLNLPDNPTGLAVSTLSNRLYHNFYDLRQDPRKQAYYWLDGQLVDSADTPDCDTYAVRQGNVSVTPVHLDWLDRPTMTYLQQALTP
jgi:5'-nucleotidase